MKNRKFMTMLTALCIAAAVTVSGCGASGNQTNKEAEKQEDVVSNEPVIFTDSCGREVEIPAEIDKIVPMGPPAQMMLMSLAPEKLTGLTKGLNEKEAEFFGEEMMALPEFGSFYGSGDLNMEALAAAEPQLIIDIGEAKNGNKEDLDGIQEQVGIPVIFVEASLDKTGEAFRTLGEILGVEDKGNELGNYCDEKLGMIKEGMDKIPEEERVNYLYGGGDNGLFVISKDSFHAEVLDMLGNNVAVMEEPTRKGSGDEISAEQLLLWNPEVVFFAPRSIYETAKDDSVWNQLKAIQDDKYYEVPSVPYNWMGMPPSINRFMGMQWVAHTLYPEVFDYDMYDATKEYYELFYDHELTKEDFSNLTKNAIR